MAETTYPRFRWFILLAMFVVTTAQGVCLISPAPLVGEISKALGVSLGASTGITMGAFNLCVAISAILGGVLLDRYGVVRVWLGASVLLAGGALLVPFVGSSANGLFLARAIQGCGAGPIMATGAPVAAQWFPLHERPIVTGVQGMCVSLGIALGFVIAPAVFQATGSWQAALAWMAVFGAAGVVFSIAVALGPRAPADVTLEAAGAGAAVVDRDLKLALAQPATWAGVACFFLLSWFMQGFNDLAPGYLAIEPPVGIGLGPMGAGKLMVALQISFMVGSVLSGVITEKLFRGAARLTVLVGFLMAAVFSVAIKYPFAHSSYSLLALCLVGSGLFQAFVNPTVLAFISQQYPQHICGKVGGLTVGIGIFGGTAGVAAGAYFLHTTNLYQMSLNVVGLVGVVGLCVGLLLVPPKVFWHREGAVVGVDPAVQGSET